MKFPWLKQTNEDDYRIYTTKFDVELTGRELGANLSASEHKIWDKQIEIYRDATEIILTEFGLRSLGHVDDVKNLASFDPTKTAVSVLVDHSGSLKGQKAIIACLLTELIADFLSRLHVKYEILGFTTVDWKGGKSRQRWLKHGRPNYPGRLNDLLHIIYRDTSETYGGAPYSVKHLLRTALLKENIDGEALFWASERLKNLDAENNIILVISDGAPVDDSTLAANGPKILWDHLVDVIRDIEATPKFKLAGIGIDYDVSNLYSDSLKIDRIDQVSSALPEFLEKQFKLQEK